MTGAVFGEAQLALGKKHLKLVTGKNRVLVDENKTLQEAEIQHGDCVVALALQPQVAATLHGFAGILADGSVAACCEEDDLLLDLESDTDTSWTFLLEDTSCLYWRRTGNKLTGVKHIQSTAAAFAAIMEDGSVVTWGNAYHGGHSSTVQDQLKGVEQIQATGGAFAAILEDGTLVTWGAARYGGDSSAVRDQLKGVKQIQVTFAAFAAIKADPGVTRSVAVTVRQFSSRACCRFNPQLTPLLRYWQMVQWLPGVTKPTAETVLCIGKIGSRVWCRFNPQLTPLLR